MRGKEKVMKGWKINGGKKKKNNLQSEMSSTRFLESISEKTHNNPILFWVYLKMTNAMMNCWQGPWLSDLTGFLFPDRWNKYFALTCSGCFFLDRTPCSPLRISSTTLPSRAGYRTGWAAGWPEPTSCTVAPAGNTSRSWPTRGWTPTEKTERHTVRYKWSLNKTSRED